MDTLDYSANLINNLTALRNQNVVHDDTEAALSENQRQFNANLALQAQEFQANQDFMNKQHSEQMDFANRNLNSNIEIANRNFNLQQEAYQKNIELQNREFNYQKELNQTQMEREDTAIQRAVADYKAAGFSPLAAVGTTGAASSPLSSAGSSSVQAAQYDVSGINNASGQYADFAKQYAALVYNARQDYSNRRSELSERHNADILASRITLAKMRQDMRLGYANLATQVFNSAVNARNARAQYDYIQEQKSYLEDKHAWESKNGYRSESWQSAFISAVKEYLNSKSNKETTIEQAFDVSYQTAEKVSEVIKDTNIKIADTVAKKLEESNLTEPQKTAVFFYLACVQRGIATTKLGRGVKFIYDTGMKLYHKFTD